MEFLGVWPHPRSKALPWNALTSRLCLALAKLLQQSETTAVNMLSTSLPKQLIAWEGEAPAEPLRGWLGRSLALPKVLT